MNPIFQSRAKLPTQRFRNSLRLIELQSIRKNQAGLWKLLSRLYLEREFLWIPDIIRVQERNPLAPRVLNTQMPCGRHAAILLIEVGHPVPVTVPTRLEYDH
jgi:hypothetical protein